MIRLIAGIDIKNGLATDGVEPWHLPTDLARLRTLTKSHGGNVLMGLKTYQTIGHPLIDRDNYILTHSEELIEGVHIIHGLQQFIADFKEDIWVFGGAQVFDQTIDKADELYLTIIHKDFNCDQFFPDYKGKFELIKSEPVIEENGLSFHYETYARRG